MLATSPGFLASVPWRSQKRPLPENWTGLLRDGFAEGSNEIAGVLPGRVIEALGLPIGENAHVHAYIHKYT